MESGNGNVPQKSAEEQKLQEQEQLGKLQSSRMGQIYIPIWAGIAGFMCAVMLLTCNCGQDKVAYSDLTLETKGSLATILRAREQNLSNTLSAQDTGTKEKKTWLETAKKLDIKTRREQSELDDFNADTSLAYTARYISTNREVLSDSITGTWNAANSFKMVPFLVLDTFHLAKDTVLQNRTQIMLKMNKYDHIMDFFKKYPIFGFWYVFSIGQMAMWFLLMVLLGGNVALLKPKIPEIDAKLFKLLSVLKFSTIPLIFMVVFTILLYRLLIDTYIIGDHYFLTYYNARMLWYAIPGYITATGCFGIYIWLSRVLDELNVKHVSSPLTLKQNTDLSDKYILLKSFFDKTFMCSAIVLTVFVIWIGILFSGINSMNAMKYYTLLSGKPFLSSDLVLLIGLMHTIILLLFYVPVTLRFNSLDITKESDKQPDQASKKIFGGLFDSLSTVLVTASPLIAGIIQHLIGVVINK